MRTAGISCSVRPKEDDEVTESSREKHAGCRGWAATVRLNRTAGSKEKELTTGGKQNAPCTQAKPGGVKHCECNVAADTPKRAKPQKHRVSALGQKGCMLCPASAGLEISVAPGGCPRRRYTDSQNPAVLSPNKKKSHGPGKQVSPQCPKSKKSVYLGQK